LPSAARLALFRICQEALTNVLKHAGEGVRVVVTQNWRADEVVLTITDADGRGGQGPATDLGDLGLGLIGMRERAELLGGTLVAGPTEGGGFQVRTPSETATAMTGVEQ
jgi:signal transduction histidine kinase